MYIQGLPNLLTTPKGGSLSWLLTSCFHSLPSVNHFPLYSSFCRFEDAVYRVIWGALVESTCLHYSRVGQCAQVPYAFSV